MFLRRNKRSFKQQAKALVSPPGGYKRALSYVIYRVKRRPGTPEYIGKGFAFGVAINYSPILFTHLLGGWILCRLFKGDLVAMFIGTLLGNPWTFAVIYPLCYKLGKTFMGLRPKHRAITLHSLDDVWYQIWPIKSWESFTIAFQEIIVPMSVGGILLALPSAFIAYFIARNAVRVYQGQRRRLIIKKFHDVEIDVERKHLS